MIKLSELKAARALFADPDKSRIAVDRIRREWNPEYASGIVATHNAADALIEIVEAALVANGTKCDCGGDEACLDTCSALKACRAVETTLSKVTL